MLSNTSRYRQRTFPRMGIMAALAYVALLLSSATVRAQGTPQAGAIGGRVVDERGAPVFGAQVYIAAVKRGTLSRSDGQYLIPNVPAGTHTLQASMIGYRTGSASVRVGAGQTATHDFTLASDPLELAGIVVTGTQIPRTNLDLPVAVTTLSAPEIELAQPRSTTEFLRYVPGFTRVESSGGEVNQNISMRGILGVEYVMFMEDGLPVFPTMHTFFMNADNLFRVDQNIGRIEVVRGGSSALFGSNTPGAIINFINETGGPEIAGTVRATGGTEEYARYDLNVNGPLGEDWRFSLGGFYRYDQGVRDPGFPGIRGGQLKANITRLLDRGYVRGSLKLIDDRNQFILPLPFKNPNDPEYVPGFSDYGAMNTREGLHLRVPTPEGNLELPLDDGLRTKAYWLTGDARFDLDNGWSVQNTAQVMQNEQGWNAILPFDIKPAADWIQEQLAALELEGGTARLFYTNHFDATGKPLPFNTANGLVSPGGQWHVEKPLTAFQNQLQVKKDLGQHSLALGLYFGHYTQTNRWFFTDILMDVRDQPRFLDLVVTKDGETTEVTKNGFRNFTSFYVNASGHTTIFSGVLGGSFQLSERLRADVGFRYEADDYVQATENRGSFDLDEDASTVYDNVTYGDGSFRQFHKSLDDWAGSVALNYRINEQLSAYGLASRAYKMPALDEFIFGEAQERVDLFEASENVSVEAGVKYASDRFALTVNAFRTELRNIVGQGAVTDPQTGAVKWILQSSPETRSFGLEL